mmetsp:Transcript_38027/g.77723  ORF Transcript_38027/g.77723 Transcript_38027/m.77723 type:complete len:207 (-) Transcript_38027:26-646(-)
MLHFVLGAEAEVRSCIQQQARRVLVMVLHRHAHRRVAHLALVVQVRAVLEQHTARFVVATGGSLHQRGDALLVDGVNVRTHQRQELHQVRVPQRADTVQQRHQEVPMPLIKVKALLMSAAEAKDRLEQLRQVHGVVSIVRRTQELEQLRRRGLVALLLLHVPRSHARIGRRQCVHATPSTNVELHALRATNGRAKRRRGAWLVRVQ